MEKCVHLSDYENILNVKKNIVLTARQDDDMYELFTSPVGIKTIIMSSAVCINQQNDKLVVSVKAGSRYDFIGFAGLAHLTTKYVLNYPPFQQFCSLSKVSIRTLTQNENVIFDFTIPAGCAENTLKAFTACLSHDRPPPSDYWIQSTLLSQTNDFQENLKSNSFFQLQYLLSRLFPPEHPLSCFPHCGQLGQLPQSTGRNRSKQSANVISNSKQSNQVDDSIDGNAAIVDEEFAIEMLHKVHEFFLRHYTPPRTCLLIRSIESIDHLKAVIQKTLLKKEFKHYFNQKPSKRIGYSSEEDEHPKFAAPQNVKGDLCILPFLTTSDTINPIVLEADFQGQDLLNSDASDRSQGENSNSAMALEQLLIELATDSNQILNSKGLASVAIQSSVNTLSVALQNRLKMNSITSTIDTEKHWLNVFWSIPVSQHCVPMLRSALRYLINILCQKSENTLITLLRDRKLASDIECRSQHSFGFVSGFEALHVRLCLTSFGLKNLELVITLLFDHLSFVCRKYPNWSHYQEQCRSSLLQMFLKNLNHVHCESYTQIAVELHKGLVVPNILYMCNFMLPDRVTLLKHMEQFGHLQKYLAPKYARFILQSNQEFTSSAFFHPISTVHCPIRRRPLDLINLLSRHISKLCTSDQKGMYEWTLLPSNPFLPTNIKVLLCPGQPDRVRLINQKPSGRLWYRCTQYLLMPLGSIHVRLSGALPSNVNDARLAAAADLLTLMLQTRIDQNLENARQTGFTFTVNVQPHQTMLIIFGYSQNMRTALIALLQQLQMREFDLNANLERLGLLYLQTVQSQAGYLCDLVKHTLFAGQPRIVNRHRELMKIDRSHVNLIYNYLFKHMQIECLVEGNFLQSDAEAFFHLLYENFPHLGSPSHQLAYQSCDWNQPALKVRVPGSGIYIFARHSASDSPSSASVNSDTIIESSSLMEELMPNAKNMIKDRNLNPGFTSTPSKRLFHCDPTIELNMPPFKRARYSTTSHTSMGSLLSMNSFISLCSDMTCTDNASDTFAESPDDGPLCGPVQPRTHILCNVFLFYFERVLIKGTTIDPLHQHLLVLMMISYVRSLSAEFFSEVLKPNLTKFYDLLESAQISIPMIEVRRAFDDVDAFDIEVDVQPLHLGVKSAFVLTLQDGNSQMSLFRLRMIMNAFLEFACLSTRDLSADRFAQIRQYALDELDRKPKFYEEVRDHWTHLMCGSLDVPAKEDYLQSIKKLRRFDFIQFANGVFCFTPGFRMLSFQLDADASTDLSQRNQGETEFSHETFAALTAPYVPSIAILDSDEYNEYIQSTPTRYPTKWVEAYRSKQ